MTRSLTVAVHGAAGTQGRPLVRRLLDAGHAVRQITRRSTPPEDARAGLSSAHADVQDLEALRRAYDGADAVVLQLPLAFDDRALAQAETVALAVERSEVPIAVLNASVSLPPVPIGSPFVDARVALAAALDRLATRSAVIGPAGPYLENLTAPWSLPRIAHDGVIAYPLPAEAPIPWLALDDLATTALDVLTGVERRPQITVAGPRAMTGDELAGALAAATGTTLRWQTISPDVYRDMLAPHLGDAAAEGIAAAYAADPPPPPDAATVRVGATTPEAWAAPTLGDLLT